MAQQQVMNPFTNKVETANFSGDDPTQEEMNQLYQFFQDESGVSNTSKFNIFDASQEEIQEYSRKQRAMGLDPSTGEELSDEEFIAGYKEENVDYSTGVNKNDAFSRTRLGNMDTAGEKLNYLQTKVGKDGVREDALGRLILTQIGRQRAGLGEGQDIAVDEEGLSWGDVKEFAGATAVPIVAATGASIAASGVGFIPGMIIVGAAGFLGKLLDEGVEYSQGLQQQSLTEVLKDARREALYAGGGEGVGRGLSALGGYLFKGRKGFSKAEQARIEGLRTNARALLEKGMRPTIAGATDEGFRPVLNRLQAVYEGVFPNTGAATSNLRLAMEELQALPGFATKQQLKDLETLVKTDIADLYTKNTSKLSSGIKDMDKAIDADMKKIFSSLKNESLPPRDLNTLIRNTQKIFDKDMGERYTNINSILKGAKVVPTVPLKAAFEQIKAQTISEIGTVNFGKVINKITSEGFTDFKTMQDLRTGINRAMSDSVLVGGGAPRELTALKNAINDGFQSAQLDLATATGKIRVKPQGLSNNQISDALADLTKTNDYYQKGMKRFDNVMTKRVVKQADDGLIDTDWILKSLVETNNLPGLNQVLNAVKAPSQSVKSFVKTDVAKEAVENATYGGKPLSEALLRVKTLAKGNPTRIEVEGIARKLQTDAKTLATIAGKGTDVPDNLRKDLATKWLQQAIDSSTDTKYPLGLKVIDPIKFATRLETTKNATVKRLFGSEYTKLNEAINVLKRSKSEIPADVAQQLDQLPLGAALNNFIKIQKQTAKISDDTFVKRLSKQSEPEDIATEIMKLPRYVQQAETQLSSQAMEGVRTAGMGKILKQIGATTDDGTGVVKLTSDFMDSFTSGRLGNKLDKVLGNYGDDTLNAMFGSETTKGLRELSKTMVKASNAATAGKGGLAAPAIALGFSVGSLLLAGPAGMIPILMSAGGFKVMSELLRKPFILKAMMASRSKNTVKELMAGKFKSGDPLGQGVQELLALLSQAGVQDVRMLGEQGAEELRPSANLSASQLKNPVQNAISQLSPPIQSGASNLMPSVTPPNSASSVGNINPIVLPNPNDQVLAERAYARGNR